MSDSVKLPVKPLINPLSDEDRVVIEQVLARLPEIHDLLHRAEACGIDVTDRRAKHEMHHAIAHRLHAHFFPKELPSVME